MLGKNGYSLEEIFFSKKYTIPRGMEQRCKFIVRNE